MWSDTEDNELTKFHDRLRVRALSDPSSALLSSSSFSLRYVLLARQGYWASGFDPDCVQVPRIIAG